MDAELGEPLAESAPLFLGAQPEPIRLGREGPLTDHAPAGGPPSQSCDDGRQRRLDRVPVDLGHPLPLMPPLQLPRRSAHTL